MKLMIALTAAALLAGPGFAAPKQPQCRDAKGHFAKCPPHQVAATMGVTKDAKGRCRKNGKFAKCA
jgi:hypothetical protein